MKVQALCMCEAKVVSFIWGKMWHELCWGELCWEIEQKDVSKQVCFSLYQWSL